MLCLMLMRRSEERGRWGVVFVFGRRGLGVEGRDRRCMYVYMPNWVSTVVFTVYVCRREQSGGQSASLTIILALISKRKSIGISTHPSKVPKTSDSLRDPTSSSGPGPEGQPDHAEIGPSGSWHVLVPRGCEYSGLDLFRCPFCLERRVTGQSPNFLKFGRAGDISDHRLRGIGNFDSWLSWLILALFLLLVQILEH